MNLKVGSLYYVPDDDKYVFVTAKLDGSLQDRTHTGYSLDRPERRLNIMSDNIRSNNQWVEVNSDEWKECWEPAVI